MVKKEETKTSAAKKKAKSLEPITEKVEEEENQIASEDLQIDGPAEVQPSTPDEEVAAHTRKTQFGMETWDSKTKATVMIPYG